MRLVPSIKNESASSLGFLGKRAENINELQYTKLEIRKEIRGKKNPKLFFKIKLHIWPEILDSLTTLKSYCTKLVLVL